MSQGQTKLKVSILYLLRPLFHPSPILSLLHPLSIYLSIYLYIYLYLSIYLSIYLTSTFSLSLHHPLNLWQMKNIKTHSLSTHIAIANMSWTYTYCKDVMDIHIMQTCCGHTHIANMSWTYT